MLTVSLEGAEFFAYHGLYEEERKVGNKFIVDIEVVSEIKRFADTENIKNTINYEDLFLMAREEIMNNSYKLIETLSNNIATTIFYKFPEAEKVKVSIAKLNPPIGGKCDRAKVTVVKER